MTYWNNTWTNNRGWHAGILCAFRLAVLIPAVMPSFAWSAPEAINLTASTEQALRLFEARVKDNPHDDANLLMLAQLQVRSAREGNASAYHQAEHSLRTAVRVNPTNEKAQALLASTLNSQHHFREAKIIAERLTSSEVKDVRYMALAVLGDAELELGSVSSARKTFTLLHKEAGDVPQVLSRLSNLNEQEGKLKEAELLLRTAITKELATSQSGADLAWYYSQLGELMAKGGEYAKAEEQFKSSLKAFPNYPAATRGMAVVATAKGDHTRAIDLYWRLLDSGVDPVLAYGPLAELYKLSKQEDSYQKVIEKVLILGDTLDHDHRSHHHHHEAKHSNTGHIHERAFALFLLDNNLQISKALHLMQHEVEKRSDLHTLDALAWAHYKSGDLPIAIEQYQAILKTGTQDPLVNYHAAESFSKAKDPKLSGKAENLLKNALPALKGYHPRAYMNRKP